MFTIPERLDRKYLEILKRKGISSGDHGFFLKWLRYFLDFCEKYRFSSREETSLAPFLVKLQERNQSPAQKHQACRAIKLYFSLFPEKDSPPKAETSAASTIFQDLGKRPRKITQSTEDYGQTTSAKVSEEKIETVTGSSWVKEFNGLSSAIIVRHYSPKTEKVYRVWLRKFQAFTHSKSPNLLSVADVKDFLTFLAVKGKVAASTQNQAFNALLFFFRHVLGKEFGKVDGVVRAKRKNPIPVVLSRDEINAILDHLTPPYDLIVKLLYGCGLRLFECLGLRLQCFNFDEGLLTIHDGKGQKDRTLPLPAKIISDIKVHIKNLKALHRKDLEADCAGVFLVDSLEKKYPHAAKEFIWQWFFPAITLTYVPETGQLRRYHLHEVHVQRAIRSAVGEAGICKRASAHTFRHSFASHLLQANYDIRTIQELLGHRDVRTTMIYTHTVKSVTKKEAKSPLDF
ncbi:MAG: integron integrase [Candidatus Ozemobacteraceae bacterium]